MLKELNNGAKAGMLILIIAGMIMGILILLGRPVPELTVWMYFAGVIIIFLSSLFAKRENKKK